MFRKDLFIKKISILIMTLVLAFSLSACGSGQTDRTDQTTSLSASSEEESVSLPEDFTVPTIEPTGLVNEKGIVITAQELIYDPTEGWGLTVTMENQSEDDVYIQTDFLAVNHFQLIYSGAKDLFYVDSGQTTTETFSFGFSPIFRNPTFDFLHMTAVTDIEVSFYVLKYWQDPGSPLVHNEKLFVSDIAELHTSEYANGPQTASISGGIEVYNKNGLQLIAKCIKDDNSKSLLKVMVFINNQSEQDVYVRSEELHINHFIFMSNMRCGADAGYTTMSLQGISRSDLRSNKILFSVRSLNTGFSIWDDIDGNMMDQTDFYDIPLEEDNLRYPIT